MVFGYTNFKTFISADMCKASAQSPASCNGKSANLQTAAPNSVTRSLEKCITPKSVQKQVFQTSICDKQTEIEQLSPILSRESKDTDGNFSDPNNNHMV